jgi:diadenosine tetraphosphatase ApaH/serine/threonine PP2A family protein phosphatase
MRYLVLSDIHSNLEALHTVLDASSALGWDRLLVLGDLVGYGADPNAVVEVIRPLEPFAIVRGNHDKVASGVEDSEGFNRIARQAAEWTYNRLTAENRDYLASLPAGPVFVDDVIELCHGMPLDEDAYVASEIDAVRALKQSERPLCVFGHTHVPCAFRLYDNAFELLVRAVGGGETLELDARARYLVNPGSVGQPRDGNPRAAFARIDTSGDLPVMTWFRVDYPVKDAQAKIIDAGLPRGLAERLSIGR